MPNRTYYTSPSAVPNDIDSKQPEQVSVYCCFNKGYTPPPFTLVQDTDAGTVKVKFELSPFSQNCSCNIECTTGALVYEDDAPEDELGEFCPADEEYEVTLEDRLFSDSDPTEMIFRFTDGRGNISTVTICSIATVIPVAPLAAVCDERVNHIQVGVLRLSYTHVDLSDCVTEYQIERYVGDPANSVLWADWTRIPAGTHFQRNSKDLLHWDRDVRSGVEYGYRVRFRTTFDQASRWGAWYAVTA